MMHSDCCPGLSPSIPDSLTKPALRLATMFDALCLAASTHARALDRQGAQQPCLQSKFVYGSVVLVLHS